MSTACGPRGEDRSIVDTLIAKTRTPCRGGVSPLTPKEAEGFHAQVSLWEMREEVRRIERTFRFGNFREALTFVRQVGELAETEGHHPLKRLAGDRHENDLMAARIDRIFDQY
jgi:4a-hydroxytetrahydrobiopterin dehydratase